MTARDDHRVRYHLTLGRPRLTAGGGVATADRVLLGALAENPAFADSLGLAANYAVAASVGQDPGAFDWTSCSAVRTRDDRGLYSARLRAGGLEAVTDSEPFERLLQELRLDQISPDHALDQLARGLAKRVAADAPGGWLRARIVQGRPVIEATVPAAARARRKTADVWI